MNTDSLKQLWKTVFGDSDSFIDTFFRMAYAPERCLYIEEEGTVISGLYWLDCRWEDRKIAYIYAVATHPDHRGKGLASRLMTQAHDRLKALGYAGAALKPAPGLFPFYARLGYVPSGFVRCFDAAAGSVPLSLTQLSAERHALLRRRLLPENSILQEGVILEFFHCFAQVYGTEDALICTDPQSGTVLEFLGDTRQLPGMLASLGLETARIRMPGKDTPFTMYLPLNCTKIPGYLGITLE